MRFAALIIAGFLIPRDARATALEFPGDAGQAVADQAAQASSKVSLEERIRHATALDAPDLPEYLPGLILRRKDEASKKEALELREIIVKRENFFLRQADAGGESCGQTVKRAVVDRERLAKAAEQEYGPVHAAQVRFIRAIAKSIEAGEAAPDGVAPRMKADAALLDTLRARFREESGAVSSTRQQLETSWSNELSRAFATEIQALVVSADTAQEASRMVLQSPRDHLLKVEFGPEGAIVRADAPGMKSTAATYLVTDAYRSTPEPFGLYYKARVSYALKSKRVEGADFREAMKPLSSPAAYQSEPDYVAGRAEGCLRLAGERLVLAEK